MFDFAKLMSVYYGLKSYSDRWKQSAKDELERDARVIGEALVVKLELECIMHGLDMPAKLADIADIAKTIHLVDGHFSDVAWYLDWSIGGGSFDVRRANIAVGEIVSGLGRADLLTEVRDNYVADVLVADKLYELVSHGELCKVDNFLVSAFLYYGGMLEGCSSEGMVEGMVEGTVEGIETAGEAREYFKASYEESSIGRRNR